MMATERDSTGRADSALALTVRAPAKLNLTLGVVGRRDDGYHELESLVVAIDLFDELVLSREPRSKLCFECDAADVPADDRNLVVQAIHELVGMAGGTEKTGADRLGLRVRLAKRIPVGAGLGGGSSDAAAALVAVNRFAGLGLPRERLAECAARLGSDVPFFLHPPAALMSGRGERIVPVSVRWDGCFLLIFPPLSCSSGRVYAHWSPDRDRPERAVNPFEQAGPSGAEALGERLFNDLEAPAYQAYPQLAEWRARLEPLCRTPLRLSGSGSTFYCPFDTREPAERTADLVRRRLGLRTFIAQILSDVTTRGAST